MNAILVSIFTNAVEVMKNDTNLKLVLRADPTMDLRWYNSPTSSEISDSYQVIILLIVPGILSFTGMQKIDLADIKLFILMRQIFSMIIYIVSLLPHGNVGKSVQSKVSVMDFYAYRLMYRENSFNMVLRGGRLLQQYVVDEFAWCNSSVWYIFTITKGFEMWASSRTSWCIT